MKFRKHKYNASVKTMSKDGKAQGSKLEIFCYDYFQDAKIDFEFQKKYTVQEKISNPTPRQIIDEAKGLIPKQVLHKTSIINPINMIIDFVIDTPNLTLIIDTKGMPTPDWLIKAKMLSYKLSKESIKPFIILTPHSQKEVKALTEYILKLI